tara:strand:+ start:522 stop:1100 length:579 start_codon:yes stop_codon:yes gene_type:complete
MMHFIEWLASTSWSIALRESLYLYPWIESAHVLFIAIFFGTLLFVDLRLSGYAFKKLSISEMNRKVLPLSIIGFILMTFTGFLLFYAIPIRNYQNLFFRIKMFLMILAGINALYFHWKMNQESKVWDSNSFIPFSMRCSAALSLGLWSLVIISGRMIAYNWFDCDKQPQSEIINFLTSCIVQTEFYEALDGI